MRFNPYDPELHQDPYPVYRELRESHPVHYEAELDFYTLSRYADVQDALTTPDVYCSGKGVAVGLGELGAGAEAKVPMLIMMDRPRHTALRTLVSRAFTPRRIAELEPRIRKVTVELLDRFSERPEAELVRDFSGPLPTIVIAELLGVPPEDQAQFKSWSTAITQFDPSNPSGVHPAAIHGPAMEMAAYLSRALELRRDEPRDDLLSALLAAEVDGRSLTPEELLGFAFLLMVAGNETTTNLISNAAIQLHHHPEQRDRLVREPGAIPCAIEEFLRYDPPVQGLARTTTRDVELHGARIPEGKKVLLLFASANRDASRFEEPDRLDVARDPNPHLAFGFGNHFCLGASLARLEARVAFEELLLRLPEYRLQSETIERHCSGPIRGALRLPIFTR